MNSFSTARQTYIIRRISVGATVILPGETKDVTGYDDNEVVKFFIGQGNLSEVKSRTAAKEK